MSRKKLFTLEELKSAIKQALRQKGTEPESISNLAGKYQTLRKNDARMPSQPSVSYAKKGWIGYRDLFGLSNNKNYLLKELKSTIKQRLKQEDTEPESISNLADKYQTLRKNDARMPSQPSESYAKKGWISYRDLFGLSNNKYYLFKELKSTINQRLKQEGTEPESISNLADKYQTLRKNDARMPSQPCKYYAKKDWKSYRYLFGLPDDKFYRFEELKFAIKKALQQEGTEPESISNFVDKYLTLCEHDIHIPTHPHVYYAKKGWKNYRDLFGLPEIVFYSLEEIKHNIKQTLKQEGIKPESIANLTHKYRTLCKNNSRMPSTPFTYYSDKGWKNFRDLFGLSDIVFYSLEELKYVIERLLKQENTEPESIRHLTNKYLALRENDTHIPTHPHIYYAKKGWISFRNLFGLPDISLYSFEELKDTIRQVLKQEGTEPESIASLTHKYLTLCKNDDRMPSTPYIYYADKGWKSFRNLFGLSETSWYSFHEAQHAIQIYLKKNNINLCDNSLITLLSLIAKDDPKMPETPSSVYAEYWLGLEFFFKRKTFYPFEKARQIAKSKVSTKNEITKVDYERLRLEDQMFPPFPEKAYYGQWRTVHHFFGCGDGFYSDLIDAQKAAIKLSETMRIKITSRTYHKLAKKDPRLPPSIDRYKPYRSEWRGWKEFAGTKKYNIDKARSIALQNDWLTFSEYSKGYKADVKLPEDPARYYGLGSYAEFIEFSYWDIKQVKTYCAENKISSINQYTKNALENKYLKVRYQAIEGFTKASDFLYKPRIFENIEDLGFEQWARLARKYLDGHAKRGFSTKNISHKSFSKASDI